MSDHCRSVPKEFQSNDQEFFFLVQWFQKFDGTGTPMSGVQIWTSICHPDILILWNYLKPLWCGIWCWKVWCSILISFDIGIMTTTIHGTGIHSFLWHWTLFNRPNLNDKNVYIIMAISLHLVLFSLHLGAGGWGCVVVQQLGLSGSIASPIWKQEHHRFQGYNHL